MASRKDCWMSGMPNLDALGSLFKEAKDRQAALHLRQSTVQEGLAQCQDEILRLTKQNYEGRSEDAQLSEAIVSIGNSLQDGEIGLHRLENEMACLSHQVAKAREALQRMEKTSSLAEQEWKQFDVPSIRIPEMETNHTARLAELQKMIEAETTSLKEAQKKAQVKGLEELKQEIDRICEELDLTRAENDALKSQIQLKEEEIEKTKLRIKSLEQDIRINGNRLRAQKLRLRKRLLRMERESLSIDPPGPNDRKHRVFSSSFRFGV